jgi:3-phenylpropionate/cinnamic acid dioxygenase small subunit
VAVDTLSWDLFDRVFTEDAQVSFGGPAAWRDRASLKRDFAAVHSPFRATMHLTANHQVEVRTDGATCLSYVHARFYRDVPEGEDRFESGGWYDDALVRTAAGWRIRLRNCRMVWATGNPVVLQTLPGVTNVPKFDALSREAAAGNVAHVAALMDHGS